MTKINYGDELEYADSRIRGSVLKVMDEERIVQVGQLNYDDNAFECSDVISGEYLRLSLQELDMTPLKLGFVNCPTYCSYTSRMPSRHYKQGLTPNTLFRHPAKGGGYGGINFNSQSVARCALGIFPSLINCTERVTCGEVKSSAFSRNFAVDYSKSLLFRTKTVGEVHFNPSNGLIHARLAPKFKFLQEMLEDESAV